jgi:hypothetical protein
MTVARLHRDRAQALTLALLLAEALVAVALVVPACSGTGDRAAPSGPSPSIPADAPTSPAISPTPTASASATGSPTPEIPATWHRSFDFSIQAIAADDEGNAYLTGLAPFGPAQDWGQSMEMVLAKIDPAGEQVWVQRWQSASRRYPDAAGLDVSVSVDGSRVYVAGEIMLPPWEATRPRLWAYSSAGELLWSTPTFPYGATSAAAAGSTGVVVGGWGWVGAWSSQGDRLWTAPFGEPSGEHCDSVSDVAIGTEGEIYVVGFLDTTPTCASVEGGMYEDADVVIQRRDPSGGLVWSMVLTDPGVTDNDWAYAVDTAGGQVLVAGETDEHAWLARVSSDGEAVRQTSWAGTGTKADALDVAPWKAVYVTSLPVGLRRLTPEGDLTWQRRLRLEAERWVCGVATAPDRVLYVAAGGGLSVWEGDLWRIRP